MAIGLVRYEWRTVGGVSFWALPAGCTSSIDLRRLSQITDPAATGYAIAIYPGPLPEGSVELDTGNETTDRDAWLSTLGFRPEGATAIDQAWSLLLDGADNAHSDAVRPLRCGRPDRLEMWLGGRRERTTTHIERLKQAVYARADLNAIFDDVQAGKLPDGIHRKALRAEANRLGIDWQTLRPKAARWKNETALDPTTQITDEGWAGTSQSLAAYGWTVWGTSNTWTTGAGVFLFSGNTNTGVVGFHPTTLSASDMIATAEVPASGDLCGPFARGSGSTDSNWAGYGATNSTADGTLQLYSFVNATLTLINQIWPSGSTPFTQRVQAVGSTIRASDNGSAFRITATNTAVTTGLRAGLWGWGGGFANVTVNVFTAEDFIAPTVTANTASGTFGDGGTVQMAYTGGVPTSWSLTGSPPTGVSINSSGLVTWTGATPTAVHSVGVRATNATGDGDGTLTLTITDPPAPAATGPTKRQLGGAVWMMGRRG